MDFSFTLADGKIWKTGTFTVDNLSIEDTDGDFNVEYDDISLKVDGKPYDGSAQTWAGRVLDVEELFDSVLSSYIIQDGDYISFSDEWSIFTKMDKYKKYENGLLMQFPVYDARLYLYKLEMATPDHRYYACDDMYRLYDKDGDLLTDMENFYVEALDEDIAAIQNGTLECLYMSPDVELYIENLEE